MLPRDTLIEHNKKLSTVPSSPLWRGAAQRRGGQSDQKMQHLCHCEPSQMAWQSSNLCRRAATQHLYFEPCTLHFIKTGHTCPVFIQSIRVWWRQYLLCPLHCAITRRRGFQTIYIDVVRGVGRQIFS